MPSFTTRLFRRTILCLVAVSLTRAATAENAFLDFNKGRASELRSAAPPRAALSAGASAVDVTPGNLPAIVNGGMLSRSAGKVQTRLHARALALSDRKTRLVIVVVDSCMMPRALLDAAKASAAKRTGIPADHLLISATHTHSAPACMGALGTDADPEYVPFLKNKLTEAVEAALSALQPARVGFGTADAAEFTALRRWIRRPDRIADDPFGNPTVRANMHAGRNWNDVTGESGPEDPEFSLLSVQSRNGRPIAVMANFSMHYFGDKDISADYFGRFCEGLKKRIAPDSDFVGILSHGCSGDIWRRDYTRPASQRGDAQTIDQYTSGLLGIAMRAYERIDYRDDADLEMAERRMTLKYRVPDKQRLEWARRVVAAMGDRLPENQAEVYAREQIVLHERQETEIVLQGVRIGDIGIATTPNETYALTGLKIKAASPLPHTMVVELANGGDGYIPPPEQHLLGGYNTWPARSAGLEVMAEPKITEACIELLERVSGQPRREVRLSRGAAARAIEKLRPAAWWRLDEFGGPRAIDSSGNHRDAFYEPAVTFFLEGPHSDEFCAEGETNRAAMFAGGRLRGRIGGLGERYSVSLWLWNGMPSDGRAASGWFFSRGRDHGLGAYGDHLGVGGTSGNAGRLVFFHGADTSTVAAGKTEIPRWQWRHVVVVRDGEAVRVYLNGKLEIQTTARAGFPPGLDRLFVGGRSDGDSNWEGRLDEVAVFDRALSAEDVAKLAVSLEQSPTATARRHGNHAAHIAARGAPPKPPAVIFDTDMGSDCDDAGALAILHALADAGEVRILGVIFSSGKNRYGVGTCDAINTYYGRGDLPLGQYQGSDVGDPTDSYTKRIATDTKRFGHDIVDKAPDLVLVYRKLLASQPDRGVTIITVGHPHGLVHLMRDPRAAELVRTKVDRWVAMGTGGWNFKQVGMSAYSAELLRTWPLPLYVSPSGKNIITGHRRLPRTPENNPVREAYRLWRTALVDGRSSWDQVAVLSVIRPRLFKVEHVGRLERRPDGHVVWNAAKDNRKHHLLTPRISTEEMAGIIEELMTRPPKKRVEHGRSRH